MPDLTVSINEVRPTFHGVVPRLEVHFVIESRPERERVHTVILQAQIQIEAPRRVYTDGERERLRDLFGVRDRWGKTLRPFLWTHAQTVVPAFAGSTKGVFSIASTFDLNVASAKYFHALEGGEVSLLFLYSGSVFYEGEDGRLQVTRVPWEMEGRFSMPVETWRRAIDHHYPNTAWLLLDRGVFERLLAYRRTRPEASWEGVIESLMEAAATPSLEVTRP